MKAYTKEHQEKVASFLLDAFLNVYEHQEVMRKNLLGLLDVLVELGLSPAEVEQLRDGFVSTGMIGRLFGVNPDTVAYWCDSGKIPAVKTAGNHRRMKIEDVVAYIAKTKLGLFREHASKVESERKAQAILRGEKDSGSESGEQGKELNSISSVSERNRETDALSRSTRENEGDSSPSLTQVDQESKGKPGGDTEEQLCVCGHPMKEHAMDEAVGERACGFFPCDCVDFVPAGSTPGGASVKTHTGESPAEMPTAEWLTGKQAKAVLHIEENGLEALRKNNSVESKVIPVGKTSRIMYKRESVLALRGSDIVRSKTVHPRTNEFIRWYAGRYREVVGASMPTNDATGGIAKRLVSQYPYEELRAASLIFLMVARSTEPEDEFLRKQGFTLQKLQSALPSMQSRLATVVQSMMGNYLYNDTKVPEVDFATADSELETLERLLAYRAATDEIRRKAQS